MEHVMLDLETLGTRAYSAIVSIGAVYFDPLQRKLGDEFYRVFELKSCGNAGLTMDSDTVKWWMQQKDEAREVFKGSGLPMHLALMDFCDFCGNPEEQKYIKMWGNGSDFDNMLLACAYEKALITAPWKFYNNRCYRTVKNFYPDIKIERVGTYHNALDDAKSQALHLMSLPIWADAAMKAPGAVQEQKVAS